MRTSNRANPLLLSILLVLPGCGPEPYEDTGCVLVPDEGAQCKPAKDIELEQLFLPGQCGSDLEIVEVRDPATAEELTFQSGETSHACCYPVSVIDHDEESECSVGRPFYAAGSLRLAPLTEAGNAGGGTPQAGQGPGDAQQRAAAWVRAGQGEHASIAAFARLSLQLMAVAAPSQLVAAAHRAALEEVGHAEACWAVAARLGAAPATPGPFPFGAPLDVDVTLPRLAAESVREGCVTETLGAHLAAVAAELSTDADARNALTTIAQEESAHAVLAYQIVAWALAAGGEPVRQAALAALQSPCPTPVVAELALRAGVPVEHLERAREEGLRQVVEPALRALLGGVRGVGDDCAERDTSSLSA